MSTFWWPGIEEAVTKHVKVSVECKKAKLHGCRYSCPIMVIHDQGPEFTGDEFPTLLASVVIKDKPIITKNTQAKAICERVHLEILNIVRVRTDLSDQLEVVLDYEAYAICASYYSVLRASPAQLLFGEVMVTRQLHSANWCFLSKQWYVYDNGNVLLDTGTPISDELFRVEPISLISWHE
ncbi:Pol Polyprotein [Phytophthora megakarya]|uniref:Pol Polyprotein n=1 Tax=Phytophthora megakarya TaxID=4795 RepID=A0A225VUG1_9STRA|nr:Pol Polyprotein [Phytophthora megakarya]